MHDLAVNNMSKFKEYKELNLPSIHRDILSLWKKNNVFKNSIQNRKNGESFTFYEGPPSANGMPGIHHVISRTIKDLFCMSTIIIRTRALHV